MDQFRFHITLSGRLDESVIAPVQHRINAMVSDALPAPFVLDTMCLAGEAEDGRFHVIRQLPLTGT